MHYGTSGSQDGLDGEDPGRARSGEGHCCAKEDRQDVSGVQKAALVSHDRRRMLLLATARSIIEICASPLPYAGSRESPVYRASLVLGAEGLVVSYPRVVS